MQAASRAFSVGLIAVMAALPAALFWITSRYGVGVSIDTMTYLDMARTLSEQTSLSQLGAHFPPGYPWVLSLFTPDRASDLSGARLVQVIFVYLNSFLVLGFVYQFGGRNPAVVALIGLALLLQFETTWLWFFAFSEPLHVILLIAMWWLFLSAISKRSTRRMLLAGLLGGLCVLVRYAGLPFLGVCFLFCAFWPVRNLSGLRVRLLLAYSSGAALPLVIWALMKSIAGISAPPRPFAFHPPEFNQLLPGLQEVGRWFHQGLPFSVVVFSLLLYLFIGIRFLQLADSFQRLVATFLLTSILCYLAFLLTTLTFFDAYLSLKIRILFPATILFILLTGILVGHSLQSGGRTTALGAISIMMIWVLGDISATRELAFQRFQSGEGLTTKQIGEMKVWSRVPGLSDTRIFSNGPELLKIHAARSASMLPIKYTTASELPNKNYQNELDFLAQSVRRGEATVVLFRMMFWREYLPGYSEVREAIGIDPAYIDQNSAIFSGSASVLAD